ncbi:MAG: PAS domain S-box protein, partial [Candidatus Hydrogenedentes bacterium]|nr:PAS domain S-box protein [Candidatus Hydrogenedentota bacterium]
LLINTNGIITFANKRFLDMTGLAESQVLEQNSLELAKRLKLDAMLPHIERRQKGVASEYRLDWEVGGGRRQFWISGSPIFNRRGRHAGTIATIRDITEQYELSQRLERYAEGLEQIVEERTRQLHESEGRLRDLLVHMNEGFLTVDAGFRIRFVNERICALLQADRGDLRGRDLFDFVEPASRGKLVQLFDLADSQGESRAHQEVHLVRGRGVPMPALVAVAPIAGSHEDGERLSLVITDLREQKHMQHQLELRARELEDANEELRMLDRAKDGFLTNVSHELRTPLSTVRGYVEMLSSGSLGAIHGSQRGALQVMGRNIERLGTLIEEMIEFSRMETRGLNLVYTLFDMAKVVEECMASAKPDILARELSTSIHVPDDMPPIWGDRKRISQVLTILLSNAIKFSHKGGIIQVHASTSGEDTVSVAVTDTGIGIEPEYRKRVFDKFFQVDSSLARRYQGAGIGLSIARNIALAHRGRVDLDSVAGQGSTFTLVMPGSAFHPGHQGPPVDVLAGLDALVAAEDPEFSGAVGQALTSVGCRVRTTDKGHEAVRLAIEEQPDVVLVDEVVGELSGVAAASRLRRDPRTMGLPVILFSGDTGASQQEEVMLDGVLYALPKPFTPDALLTRIHQVCLGAGETRPPEPPQLPAAEEKDHPNVLVVDGDADLLEWLEAALRHRRIACRCSTDLQQALAAAAESRPDLIFIDVDAPDENDEDVVDALRGAQCTRDVPIYLLTGLPGELPGDHQAHVAGVLHKPFSIKEIADIILTAR